MGTCLPKSEKWPCNHGLYNKRRAKMDFRVHNTAWIPVDYDGIRLIRRPLPQAAEADDTLKPGFSKAAKRQMAQRSRQGKAQGRDTYVIIDLETTGLQSGTDAIIEFGAIKVVGGQRTEIFSRLVCSDKPLPQQITTLTGITNATLRQQGSPPEEALDAFLAFIGQEKLVGYNITFDMEFYAPHASALESRLLSTDVSTF